MAGRNPNWARDELILALDLYFRCDPIHTSERNPEIEGLSRVLNRLPIHTDRPDVERFRNPNGVYMKLCNFLRLDPTYPGKGLDAGGRLEEQVWAEFANDQARLTAVASAIRISLEVTESEASSALSSVEQDDWEAPEGVVLLRLHKTLERSPAPARQKKSVALQRSGVLQCEVCESDFQERYGSLGDGFIECHHTTPLHQLAPGHKTKLSELALVCANCHRMLHRGGSALSIPAFRELVQPSAGTQSTRLSRSPAGHSHSINRPSRGSAAVGSQSITLG